MSEQIMIDKPLITPIYSQDQPNQPIDLGQVRVQFEHEGKKYQEMANVRMEFLPRSDLRFILPCNGIDTVKLSFQLLLGSVENKIELTLPDRSNRTVNVFCKTFGEEYGGLVFSANRSSVMVTPPSKNISSAKFHLFNFPDFEGPQNHVFVTGEPPHQGFKGYGHVVLKADGWIIAIAATARTDELEKDLRAQRGYVITHMGEISRADGGNFTSEQLDDLLNCLNYFLSFALGCWAGIALPIGFDSNGDCVFERWGISKGTEGSWNRFHSWFDKRYGELLSQVFPGFVSLWENPLWRKPLIHALYWYIGACKGGAGLGMDTGLILSQTSLELLAWNYCVQDRQIVLPNVFNNLRASDKFRHLTSDLGIPNEIPPTLSTLNGTPDHKWEDSMHAITSIRNSLVHPDNKLEVLDGWYYETYQLSLWYISLVILRLCKHDGKYRNTLGEVCTFDRVPWTKKDIEK